ncbi:MAG: tetratricopeptide repeat protein, partial [Anaerolineales bacterium]|nr:tetratricopeptide repeat protein [Anaerolineales bacterium]
QGNQEAETAAWSAYLNLTDQRLVVIRALQPENLDLARQATLAYPYEFSANFWYAELLEKAGEDQAALQAYQQAAAAQPLHGLTHYRMGMIYEKLGDRQAALQAYDWACALGDQGKNGCIHAGYLYLEFGQYELAEKRFRTSLVQLHNFPPSIIGLARALLGQGRTAEAIQLLQPLASAGNTDAQELLASLTSTP